MQGDRLSGVDPKIGIKRKMNGRNSRANEDYSPQSESEDDELTPASKIQRTGSNTSQNIPLQSPPELARLKNRNGNGQTTGQLFNSPTTPVSSLSSNYPASGMRSNIDFEEQLLERDLTPIVSNPFAAINSQSEKARLGLESIIEDQAQNYNVYRLAYGGNENDPEKINVEESLRLLSGQLNEVLSRMDVIAKAENTILKQNDELVKFFPFLAEQFQKKMKKATGGTNYISKFANYTTPWNNDAEGYKVVVGEHQRLLKYFSRLEIKAEIIRCQNELWIPPYIEIGGKKRSLKALIQALLAPSFAFIDYPSRLGTAVAQFLWPKDHFKQHQLTAFNGPSGPPRQIVPQGKIEIPGAEKNLFIKIMAFVGCKLFADNDQHELKHAWMTKARNTINHRGKTPETIRVKMPTNFIPIFERDVNKDEQWIDLDCPEFYGNIDGDDDAGIQ